MKEIICNDNIEDNEIYNKAPKNFDERPKK